MAPDTQGGDELDDDSVGLPQAKFESAIYISALQLTSLSRCFELCTRYGFLPTMIVYGSLSALVLTPILYKLETFPQTQKPFTVHSFLTSISLRAQANVAVFVILLGCLIVKESHHLIALVQLLMASIGQALPWKVPDYYLAECLALPLHCFIESAMPCRFNERFQECTVDSLQFANAYLESALNMGRLLKPSMIIAFCGIWIGVNVCLRCKELFHSAISCSIPLLVTLHGLVLLLAWTQADISLAYLFEGVSWTPLLHSQLWVAAFLHMVSVAFFCVAFRDSFEASSQYDSSSALPTAFRTCLTAVTLMFAILSTAVFHVYCHTQTSRYFEQPTTAMPINCYLLHLLLTTSTLPSDKTFSKLLLLAATLNSVVFLSLQLLCLGCELQHVMPMPSFIKLQSHTAWIFMVSFVSGLSVILVASSSYHVQITFQRLTSAIWDIAAVSWMLSICILDSFIANKDPAPMYVNIHGQLTYLLIFGFLLSQYDSGPPHKLSAPYLVCIFWGGWISLTLGVSGFASLLDRRNAGHLQVLRQLITSNLGKYYVRSEYRADTSSSWNLPTSQSEEDLTNSGESLMIPNSRHQFSASRSDNTLCDNGTVFMNCCLKYVVCLGLPVALVCGRISAKQTYPMVTALHSLVFLWTSLTYYLPIKIHAWCASTTTKDCVVREAPFSFSGYLVVAKETWDTLVTALKYG